MAVSGKPAQRRTPGAYQPIEVIEESPPEQPRPSDPALIEPSPEPVSATRPESFPAVPIAVRFGSAASALVFAGQLLAACGAPDLTFYSGSDQARWVRSRVELDIARELAGAARGNLFVATGTGQLAEDLGWGEPPAAVGVPGLPRQSADPAALSPVSLAELVGIAGLHHVHEQPTAAAHMLLPGYLLPMVLGRALDLRLDAAHRPVRLYPLFEEANGRAGRDGGRDGRDGRVSGALIELRLRARRGTIPTSLLAALARESQINVCRVAGDTDSLLVEYGMASPLLDHMLARMIDGQTWVLASEPLGCHVIEARGTFADSSACVRLRDSRTLQSPVIKSSDDRPAPAELHLVRESTPGQAVDAILLANDDLDAVALLLEGHLLSESAQLVRGRDRHLLTAPGGVLEHLPVGEALYCVGPGPLYLPLGYGTRPRLPPSARRALFAADERTTVVVLPNATLQFSLDYREPVWALWVGPPPEINVQLPDDTVTALDEIRPEAPDPAEAAGGADDRGAHSARANRTWLDDALDAELRGALALAGELHERHGDPIRAARLFARAALETADPGEVTTGNS